MNTNPIEPLPEPQGQPLAVVPHENPGTLMRHASDVAGVCREIVLKTASQIQGRKFVRVEGWQAIATAHGCCLSIEDVEEDEKGNVTAWAAVRRLSDGLVLAKGQGFVGADERTWAKRDRYARRAMAQTRAMSRVARSVFAHVVVLIDQDLSTTPAEEMPEEPQPAPPVKPAKLAPKRSALAKPKGPANALGAFQERCKARLVKLAQADPLLVPYWQRYAVSKGWILGTEDIGAILGNVTQVFQLDPNQDIAGNTDHVKAQFEVHEKAVKQLAMSKSPPITPVTNVAMGYVAGEKVAIGHKNVAMSKPESNDDGERLEHPADEEPISIGGATDAGKECPNCGHGSVVMSKEYDGILLCQACAWQWDIQSGDYFEEHDWAKAICPIPPRGTKKADYEPQTLGQIARTEPKRFFGLVQNNSEEKALAGREWQGKHYESSQEDIEFGIACDRARAYMDSQKEDTGEDADPENNPF